MADNSGKSLWHGRFADDPSAELMEFTASLAIDSRLAEYDLVGSRAHVEMLGATDILTADEVAEILAALAKTGQEIEAGTFAVVDSDEDIHTAIERRVTEIAGATGAKIHTGRSRNDQVATDLRLWFRDAVGEVVTATHNLQSVLLNQAEVAGTDVYLPGYTHLQRAQPVLLAHHLLAHFWALARDADRWRDALDRANVSPLGAGALAGSSLPIDPAQSAEKLGFARSFENSLDAVSDRDFVAEGLFTAALEQVHLSRIGEEIVLWASAEFGFIDLAESHSTGSSMLPHKKNPDIAELARGKSGRLIGNLTGFLATLKGLPLAYNRDLQEDKEPIFDAFDTLNLSLSALAGLLAASSFNSANMRAAADTPENSVTDLAEYLVKAGVPFRDAHARVGALVREARESGVELKELVATTPDLGPEAVKLFAAGAAVSNRLSPGGAGPGPLAVQLVQAHEEHSQLAIWISKHPPKISSKG